MSEKKKKIIALGKPGGGTGEAVWGSIGGNIGDQTDLQNELAGKADVSEIPSNTSDLYNDSGFITINDIPAQVNSDWNSTSGASEILNKPNISPSWYGSQEEFDAIPENELDENTDYFISSIDYSEISNTPFIPTSLSQLENDKDFISSSAIDSKIFDAVESIRERDVYLTQDEYDALELAGKLEEDKAYHIENEIDTIVMSVTFTDQSTGVYEVYIKPSNGGSN